MNNPISSEYMVRVQCMTYNHAPYIEDAMNGFCMQETDFPFVCVIVDDASTDGEQEVIKRYLNNNFDLQNDQFFREEDTDDYHLIFARHKTNLNCYFGVLLLKYNHWGKKDKAPYYESWSKAKYIAFCEGDDYWIYKIKLQMQVDFLKTHHDYGMVYTSHMLYYQKDGIITKCESTRQSDFEDLLVANKVSTLTTLVSCELYEDYMKNIRPIAIKKKWKMGDYPLWLYIMSMSKAKHLQENTSVYRVLENSASHFTDHNKTIKFIESTYDISYYFARKNNVSQSLLKEIARYEINLLLKYTIENDTDLKFDLFNHMVRFGIFSPQTYVSIKLKSYKKTRTAIHKITEFFCRIRCQLALRTHLKEILQMPHSLKHKNSKI